MTRYVWAGNPGKEKRDWIARINRAMTNSARLQTLGLATTKYDHTVCHTPT